MSIAVDPTSTCAFCRELAKIDASGLPDAEELTMVEELFDRRERVRRAHRAYGRRRGYLR